MSSILEEKERLGAVLKYELDKNYCREVVTIASGQNLKMGSILAKTEDGSYQMVSTDGTAAGVLLADVDASESEQKALMLARVGIVANLIYPDGATDDQQQTILDQLDSRGIIIRTEA